MVRLVDDLLDAARISRGKVELRYEPFDFAAAVEDAIEQVRPLVERKRHALAVHPPREPALVDGDCARLTQVVANLLNNAARYTPEGRRGAVLLIAQSGYGQAHDRAAGIAAGFDHYFVKPLAAAALFDVLRRARSATALPS